MFEHVDLFRSFFVCVFVGAIEMHGQLMVGACCLCIYFICLLKVNNLLVFCSFGACVSILPWDLRVLLDVLCCPINHSFIHSIRSTSFPYLGAKHLEQSSSGHSTGLQLNYF